MGNKKKKLEATPGSVPEVPEGTDEMPPVNPAYTRARWAVEALGVFLVALAFFNHLQGLSKYVIACDSYFHAKMAVLIRESGPVKDFIWTTTSVFRTNFSDSSFLYHVMLIPFTFMSDEVAAIKLGAAFFSALYCALFYTVLRVNRCRLAFLFTLMIGACGSLFLYRMCQNRGYLLAIMLALLTVEACINHRHRLLFALAIAYPLSYTAFQVVLVIPVIFHVAQLFNGERLDRKLLPIAAAGSLIGLVIHPNRFDDFYLWWVQNVLVMWYKWTSDVNLFFGGELYPPELSFLTKSTTAVLVTLIACSIATVVSTRRRSTATLTWFGVTLFFGVLTLASKRFIEYSAPFTLAYAAFLLRDLVSDEDLDDWSARAPTIFMVVAWVVTACCGALLYRSYYDVKKDLEAEPEPGLKAAALWLKSHAAKNDIVYTCDWDDFPQLFFYNSEQRYLICLDPMFFYAYDKNLWQTWFDTSNVRTQDVFNNVKLKFKANWVLATNDFQNFIKKANGDPRFRRVFTDKDATIFQVLDELPNFLTQWSVSNGYPNERQSASEPLVLENLAHPNAPLPPEGGLALSLSWTTWPAAERGSFLDLERFITMSDKVRDKAVAHDHVHAYCVTRVTSPIAQDADLRLGYDDAVTVWLNGAMLVDERGPSEVSLDGRRQTLHLKQGENVLAVRCGNYRGNWGFMARLFPARQPVTTAPFAGPVATTATLAPEVVPAPAATPAPSPSPAPSPK